MNTGMYFLEIGLLVAVVGGIYWWMKNSAARSREQRRLTISSKQLARQAWGDERSNGRGIR